MQTQVAPTSLEGGGTWLKGRREQKEAPPPHPQAKHARSHTKFGFGLGTRRPTSGELGLSDLKHVPMGLLSCPGEVHPTFPLDEGRSHIGLPSLQVWPLQKNHRPLWQPSSPLLLLRLAGAGGHWASHTESWPTSALQKLSPRPHPAGKACFLSCSENFNGPRASKWQRATLSSGSAAGDVRRERLKEDLAPKMAPLSLRGREEKNRWGGEGVGGEGEASPSGQLYPNHIASLGI